MKEKNWLYRAYTTSLEQFKETQFGISCEQSILSNDNEGRDTKTYRLQGRETR